MKKLILLTAAILLVGAMGVSADVKANWSKECAKCHGEDGKGDTKMGKRLKVKDYTDAAVQAKMTDEEMTKAIKEGVKEDGRTKMKAFGDLSADDVAALVKLIRGFKK